jgi:alpha-tubulin suppressor-like RCC1 family protein
MLIFLNPFGKKRDIFEEYKQLKMAFLSFRKENEREPIDLHELTDHLSQKMNLDPYSLSKDGKFLIVKGLEAEERKEILRRVGGKSVIKNELLYLSFLSLNKTSEIIPEARFKVIPGKEITTTTLLEYDASQSVAEDQIIKEYKWENNRQRFKEAGTHTIRLRIMDQNGNWSEWAEETIEVVEKPGLRSIAAGRYQYFIVKWNGHVYGAGENTHGGLGIGTTDEVMEPKRIDDLDFVESVASGEHHTLFKTYDGKVYAAGRNDRGQLGLGNRQDSRFPREVWGMDRVKQVACGYNHSGVLTVDGDVYLWGDNQFSQLTPERILYKETAIKMPGLENIKQISLGATHGLALRYNGTVLAWGDNDHGQLGVGMKSGPMEVVMTEFKNIKQVMAGDRYTICVTNSNRVVVCGLNDHNQLGITGRDEYLFPEELLSLKGILRVEAKGDFVLALSETGKIYTWGRYNPVNHKTHAKPVQVDGIRFIKSMAAAEDHGYAIVDNDEVVRWNHEIDRMITIPFAGEEASQA